MKTKSLFTTLLIVCTLSFGVAALSADQRKPANPSELQETYVGDFVADAMKAALKADVALINGSSLGFKEFPVKITHKNVGRIVPFDNDLVVVVELKGVDLLKTLEKSSAAQPRRSTSFLQVSGVTYTCDLNGKTGARAGNVTVGGKPLDLNAKYTVATTDFLSGGGGGLTPLRNSRALKVKSVPLGEIIAGHAGWNQNGKPAGRIIIISKKSR